MLELLFTNLFSVISAFQRSHRSNLRLVGEDTIHHRQKAMVAGMCATARSYEAGQELLKGLETHLAFDL